MEPLTEAGLDAGLDRVLASPLDDGVLELVVARPGAGERTVLEKGELDPIVGLIGDFLYRITEPALRPIRNIMPDLGGIDISPVILILIIIFIRYVIALYILPNVF